MQRRWVVRAGDDLGAAVAEIRRTRGLTQAQLSEQSGLSRHWLAKLEAGRSAVVLDHLLGLLRRLGATVVVTFDDERDDKPTNDSADERAKRRPRDATGARDA